MHRLLLCLCMLHLLNLWCGHIHPCQTGRRQESKQQPDPSPAGCFLYPRGQLPCSPCKRTFGLGVPGCAGPPWGWSKQVSEPASTFVLGPAIGWKPCFPNLYWCIKINWYHNEFVPFLFCPSFLPRAQNGLHGLCSLFSPPSAQPSVRDWAELY